jgi:hypothetical protein
MELKYWKYINFIGKVERIQEDAKRLLDKIGAYDDYGTTGWGPNGNLSIFETAIGQTHSTWSQWKVWQWYTPALERQVEAYYAADYAQPLFNFTMTDLTQDFFVKGADKIYRQGDWDGAPIVVEKYKLIFLTVPKMAATKWKQALRRMEGMEDWAEVGGPKMLPHDPLQNGLKYLYDYNVIEASDLMTNPNYTRAIFIRNPKDRFLSVYNEMVTNPDQVTNTCCPHEPGTCAKQTKTMLRFLDLIATCKSAHWDPQYERIDERYWKQMNFIGRLEHIQEDARKLLERVGAWEEIGATGWGPFGDESIFAPTGHELDHVRWSLSSYTPVVDRLVEEMYKVDYEHNAIFDYAKVPSTLGGGR